MEAQSIARLRYSGSLLMCHRCGPYDPLQGVEDASFTLWPLARGRRTSAEPLRASDNYTSAEQLVVVDRGRGGSGGQAKSTPTATELWGRSCQAVGHTSTDSCHRY
jgi:hypothetical protein